MNRATPWQPASRPWHRSRPPASQTRLPEGAELVDGDGDTVHMQVSMPVDEHGFFGRQCPSCSQLFRIDADEYQALPDEQDLCCVYCGHRAEASDFMTAQQLERAMSAVSAWAMQRTHDVLDGALRRISRPRPSSRGFGIHVSHRSRPFYPQPLPGIDEEKLIRIRQCPACDLHYAVFGEHRFCPVCGPLPVDLVALDALAAEPARLDALPQLPAAAAANLREQGVFTRVWVDTLKNLAGIVETLAGAVFRAAVPNADQALQGKGNVFQRLDPAADLFVTHGYPDMRQRLDPAVWQRLLQTWAVRHVFTHRDGVVDAKYLTVVPASTVQLGQRLTVTEPQTRQAISDTRDLCRAIAALTAPP